MHVSKELLTGQIETMDEFVICTMYHLSTSVKSPLEIPDWTKEKKIYVKRRGIFGSL